MIMYLFQDENSKMSLTSMTFCDVNNTAQWIGLSWPSDNQNLIQFLSPYWIYLGTATLFTTVSYYQTRKRF